MGINGKVVEVEGEGKVVRGCGCCEWSAPSREVEAGGKMRSVLLTCRARPPVARPAGGQFCARAEWPEVSADEWCAAWRLGS